MGEDPVGPGPDGVEQFLEDSAFMFVSKVLGDRAPCDRPMNLLATPEAIDRLVGRWRVLTIAILNIVWGKQQENENASIISGDDLVALNIPSLSDHLKFLTT